MDVVLDAADDDWAAAVGSGHGGDDTVNARSKRRGEPGRAITGGPDEV
jgi:hypothetical protein